ncbi:MAG: glycosyltransferase family 4 protein [Nannocystaceae bacterium]|nr:glycosyltransferase family 4 protein [bacterium]
MPTTRTLPKVMYVAAMLPKRSETFVYRELLGLRAAGWDVSALSIRPPERDLGSATLEQLAAEAEVLYRGVGTMLAAAAAEATRHPRSTLRTLGLAGKLALGGDDISGLRRAKLVWQALGVLGAAQKARKHEVEHVHAHMAHVPASVAMLLASQLGVPFSFTGHAVDIFSQRTLLKTKLKRAAFCACISQWHQRFYQELLRDSGARELDEHRLPVVRCGVDVSEFSPPASRPPGPIRIVTVGRLIEKKGFDLLLHALAKQPADMPAFQCTIMGGGEEAQALESLRDALKLQDRVEFTGAVPNHEVRERLQAADLFVLPCRIAKSGDRDGIPVVLMEAMASGVPVIAGDIPSIRELVRHEGSGLLVAPESVTELSTAITRMLRDDETRDRLARGGRDRVVEEFDLALNVGRIGESIARAHGVAP